MFVSWLVPFPNYFLIIVWSTFCLTNFPPNQMVHFFPLHLQWFPQTECYLLLVESDLSINLFQIRVPFWCSAVAYASWVVNPHVLCCVLFPVTHSVRWGGYRSFSLFTPQNFFLGSPLSHREMIENSERYKESNPDQNNVTGHLQLLERIISLFPSQFVESKCMKIYEFPQMTSQTSMEGNQNWVAGAVCSFSFCLKSLCCHPC